jgi:hypothetical protein
MKYCHPAAKKPALLSSAPGLSRQFGPIQAKKSRWYVF